MARRPRLAYYQGPPPFINQFQKEHSKIQNLIAIKAISSFAYSIKCFLAMQVLAKIHVTMYYHGPPATPAYYQGPPTHLNTVQKQTSNTSNSHCHKRSFYLNGMQDIFSLCNFIQNTHYHVLSWLTSHILCIIKVHTVSQQIF